MFHDNIFLGQNIPWPKFTWTKYSETKRIHEKKNITQVVCLIKMSY